MDIVNSILRVPEIWSDVAPKGVSYFEAPYVRDCTYFLVNRTESVIIYHPFLDGVKIHPNFPKKYRGKAAYQAIEESVIEMFSRGNSSIYAEIDVELKHVNHAARFLGFKLLESGKRNIYVRRRLNS